MLALIDELGLKTFKTYDDGENVYYRHDAAIAAPDATRARSRRRTRPRWPSSRSRSPSSTRWRATVPLDAPWKAPQARRVGRADLRDLEARATRPRRRPATCSTSAIEAVFAAEPRDLSLLHVLFYIARRRASFENLINTAGGAQESAIVGGSQRISIELAKQLGARGRARRAGATRSSTRRAASRSQTPTGHLAAKRVIVTVPPTLAGRIRYEPGAAGRRATSSPSGCRWAR